MLAYGVTSVRDMGGDLEELTRWRDEVERGVIPGPRIFLAGPMLESPKWMEGARERQVSQRKLDNHIAVGSADEANEIVDRLAAAGVDFIKVRSWASREIMEAIGEAGKRHSLRIVGHPDWSLDPVDSLEAGVTGFEHGFYPWPAAAGEKRQRFVDAMIRHQAALVPTLVTWKPRTIELDLAEAITEDELGLLALRRRYLSPVLIDSWRNGLKNRRNEDREGLEGWRAVLDQHAEDIGRLHDEGVTVLPGTDLAGSLIYPGSSLHEELAIFVEKAGLSPAEAIVAATRDSAKFMGRADLGSITEGQIADLVLLRLDPVERIQNLAAIRGVMKAGCYRDSAELSGLLHEIENSERQ